MDSAGNQKANAETPSLCLDLARFEANLCRISKIAMDAGKEWRPHTSCHYSPTIAKRQFRQSATGLTCSRVSDAEIFASEGFKNILIVRPPVGAERIRRMAKLCQTENLIASCDHYVQAAELSAACVRHHTTCRVVIDINIGMDRTGVRPGHDTLELARGIEKLCGLKLVGIMGYEGHAMSITDVEVRQRSINSALGILSHTHDIFQKNGLCCEIVSAGGTGSLFTAIQCEKLTEVRAGGIIFGDSCDSNMPLLRDLEHVLTILATVVSRPAFDRAVLDIGLSSIWAEQDCPLRLKGWPDAKVVKIWSDQTALELGPNSRELRIGDRVEIIVTHSRMTTRLHDQYLCFRGDHLEEIWPIRRRSVTV